MGTCCSNGCQPAAPDSRFRRVLWIALIINAVMFGVELAGGLRADSASLLADSVDFLGDATNYGLSLVALALAPLWRSRAALTKGVTMGAYGIGVLSLTLYNIVHGSVPEPATMGAIGALALLANVSVAVMLYRYRDGDANMQSVWLCSRNDAIGNLAVLLAAAGIYGSGTSWPDLLVAALMALLAINASFTVMKTAWREITLVPAAVS